MLKCEVCGTEYFVEVLDKPNSKFDKMALCKKHRNSIKNNGYIRDKNPPKTPMKFRKCDYCDKSGAEVKVFIRDGENLCQRHYNQVILYGKVLERTVFDKNKIILNNTYAEVVMYDLNKEECARTIIDLDDVELISNYKWSYDKSHHYAYTRVNTVYLSMQQLLMKTKTLGNSVVVDHIDRNGLNNRKDNLRITNKSVNAINAGLRSNNKSGITGVSFSSVHNLWRSYINFDGKRLDLGWFKNKEDAIKTRLNAELKYYPDYPPQADLFEKYNIKACD